MRVAIIALLHESNTFIAEQTTIEHFKQDILLRGDALRARLADTHHEVAGFFAGLEGSGIEAVPVFAARALPFGVLTAETLDFLLRAMFEELQRAGPLDGLLVAPHGATVSQSHRDADGYWLSRLRAHFGPQLPMISTLDAHANLSPAMVAACQAIVAYRTNPHIDQRQRGLEAAGLMVRLLRGQIQPTMAAVMPPAAINIQRQHTSGPPCTALYHLADSMLKQPGVLSNSILLGFPYADVEEMGSSVIVVTDNDLPLARQLAGRLGDYLWTHRHDFAGEFIGIDEALDRANDLEGPVCLLDMGDNTGGGSPADCTHLARAIHSRRLARSFVCLYDPESVQQAEAAGVGQTVQLGVGGKTLSKDDRPLRATFTVVSLHDGKFRESEPRHGGFTDFDQGRTAIVRTGYGLCVMLTSRRMTPFSLRQLTSCDLDPSSFHILVAKGVNAPRAAYEEVCRHFICVNTPGVTCADMRQLEYHNRRRPMFPFEPDMDWSH